VTLALMPRNPGVEIATLVTDIGPKDTLHALRVLLWPLAFAAVAFAVGSRLPRRSWIDALAVVAFVAGALLVTFAKDNRFHRIVLTTLIALFLALALLWLMKRPIGAVASTRSLIVGGALLIVPFAYSFGTSNALLQHMGMAAIFPVVVSTVLIRSLWIERAISTWAFAVALALLTALPAEILVRQWVDGRYTYRLGAPLAEQTVPLPTNPGGIDLRVTPGLARSLDGYLLLLRSAGFLAGQPMIDFTGQSPGLVAIANGTPVGAIWLIGGIFDGDRMARLSLGWVDAAEVRRAWLLTSPDGETTISSWRSIVEERLGNVGHEEAGRFTIPDPSSDDKSKTIEVTLWRPLR
jgi:hypothetical protein